MKHLRALIPAALAAALLLTGCSTGSDVAPKSDGKASDASGCLTEGSTSKAIAVDGDFGGEVKLSSKTPITADTIERSVLITGDGAALESGDQVQVSLSVFNGRTGKLLTHESPTMTNDKAAMVEWAYGSIACATVGDRVATVVPQASDLFGEGKVASTGLEGLEETDPLILIFDVKSVVPTRAEGTAKEAPAGFPKVELDKDGKPTITIPKDEAAPTTLQVATLIEGDGETVQPGDTVTVNYRGVIWRTGEEFDSSWSRGQAATFTTTGVIGGFQKALEGQKVGSQVIAVVPASTEQGGYGADTLKSQGHEPDDVMVFVLDILATAR